MLSVCFSCARKRDRVQCKQAGETGFRVMPLGGLTLGDKLGGNAAVIPSSC